MKITKAEEVEIEWPKAELQEVQTVEEFSVEKMQSARLWSAGELQNELAAVINELVVESNLRKDKELGFPRS